MMLTAKQAADLALKHGLSLTDASALSRMTLETAEEADSIAAAFAAPPKPRQLAREDVQRMSPDQINEARENGQLDSLLNGEGQ
jgi:hypothetical protein